LTKILVIIGLIMLILGVLLISSAGVVIGIIGLLILALGAALVSKKETQQLYSQSQYS
jgi:hypothetical protein